MPNDRPKLQIFPQQGIRVERAKSSRQHVYLFDLQLEASGTYRCEVSAEAPSFRTKHEEKVMVVVQPPHTNEITGLQPRGDTSQCSAVALSLACSVQLPCGRPGQRNLLHSGLQSARRTRLESQQ